MGVGEARDVGGSRLLVARDEEILEVLDHASFECLCAATDMACRVVFAGFC